MFPRTALCLCLLPCLLPPVGTLLAADSPAAVSSENPDSRGRATAIALNYCRASFHRIRKYQSNRVLLEEQEKILDNLNLNGIGDQEVINLYSAVLDEIGDIEVADREKAIFHDKYKKALFREIEATAFVALAQTATMSINGLVQTGVRSWLDYRDLQWNRDFDSWKVEKDRMNSVVDKSSKFLDTFWKQAKAKNIPDRWLVRGTDLDRLTEAMQEPDLETRLRVLQRMESFMECYPPYWYYVGRTQQGLGQFYEAAETYDKLADLAHGHFRRDDMMTAALANRAIIQQHLNQPGADRTAREALTYSTSVWEANLMCAQVLEASGRYDDAKDAILRNLDVNLESQLSSVALLGLYYRQNRLDDLAAALADPEFIARVPMLSIVQSLAKLGPQRTPGTVMTGLRNSIRVAIEPRFGVDDLLVACGSSWQPEKIQSLTFYFPGQLANSVSDSAASAAAPAGLTGAKLEPHAAGGYVFRYARAIEASNRLGSSGSGASLTGSVLRFEYPAPPGRTESAVLFVVLGTSQQSDASVQQAAPWWQSASPIEIRYGDARIRLDGTWQPGPATPGTSIADNRSADGTGKATPPLDQPPRPAAPKRPATSVAIDEFVPIRVSADVTPDTSQEGNGDKRFEPSRRPPRVTILGVRPASSSAESSDADANPQPSVPPPPAQDGKP
ncbi:hypothetical protein GC176_10545 [bacterium]|nr:hypothetical protein [bacterium]